MSQASATTEPRGPQVDDHNTTTYRQVPLGFLTEGRVTRQAFEVKDRDGGLLSIALSSKTTAQEAFKHHTETLKLKSAAVYAVTVGECASVQLLVWEDPESEPAPNDAHGVIDFRKHLSSKAEKKIRETTLAQLADKRGPVYEPRRS